MKRTLSLLAFSTLLITPNASAFDFGSMMQSVAPVATAVAPIADQKLVSNPLIKNITTSLGVTPTQAIGGTAAILNDAKGNMSATDYSALTKQMPAVGSLISAAPAGMLNLGSVDSQFSMLGMDASMIGKFTPFVLQYLQSGTTPGMAQIVQAALVP